MSLSRVIKSPQRQMRMLAYQKTGLGSPVLVGEGKLDGTIADTPAGGAVGDYTLTFELPFVRAPLCHAVSTTSATVVRCVAAVGSVQILCFAMDGTTPAEADFDLICLGSDVTDQL